MSPDLATAGTPVIEDKDSQQIGFSKSDRGRIGLNRENP
jgi:hypothetical protein